MISNPAFPHLSVIIPAYNEERSIRESLRRIESFLSFKAYDWECIVSSDGSSDKTVDFVNDFIKNHPSGRFRLVSNDKNHGKGFTVRRGILAAGGKYLLVTDADLSAPIKEVDKLTKALDEGYDIAVGSRALADKSGDVQQSFKRWFAGRVFNGLVRAVVLRGFSDTQCGFKCFKKEAARRLFQMQRLDGFGFDVEILYLAQKEGLRVKEVPIMWRQAPGSHVRLMRDSLSMFRELFLIRKYHA